MNRRDFLVHTTAASLTGALALSATEAFGAGNDVKPKADATPAKDGQSKVTTKPSAPPAEPPKSPVNCAVIGLGEQGTAILETLNNMGTGAPIVAICDTYKSPVFIRKAKERFHNDNVAVYDDYKRVLDDKSVQAVFIATPSHKHKQIALDAIAAGKHVYLRSARGRRSGRSAGDGQSGYGAKTFSSPVCRCAPTCSTSTFCTLSRSRCLDGLHGPLTVHMSVTSWRRMAPTDARQAS